jgi:hypothetical protein
MEPLQLRALRGLRATLRLRRASRWRAAFSRSRAAMSWATCFSSLSSSSESAPSIAERWIFTASISSRAFFGSMASAMMARTSLPVSARTLRLRFRRNAAASRPSAVGGAPREGARHGRAAPVRSPCSRHFALREESPGRALQHGRLRRAFAVERFERDLGLGSARLRLQDVRRDMSMLTASSFLARSPSSSKQGAHRRLRAPLAHPDWVARLVTWEADLGLRCEHLRELTSTSCWTLNSSWTHSGGERQRSCSAPPTPESSRKSRIGRGCHDPAAPRGPPSREHRP